MKLKYINSTSSLYFTLCPIGLKAGFSMAYRKSRQYAKTLTALKLNCHENRPTVTNCMHNEFNHMIKRTEINKKDR